MPSLPRAHNPVADTCRRRLMVLSLGSPLAAAGALFAGPSASAQAENLLTLPPLPRPRGYQRSEHINTYYRSLRY